MKDLVPVRVLIGKDASFRNVDAEPSATEMKFVLSRLYGLRDTGDMVSSKAEALRMVSFPANGDLFECIYRVDRKDSGMFDVKTIVSMLSMSPGLDRRGLMDLREAECHVLGGPLDLSDADESSPAFLERLCEALDLHPFDEPEGGLMGNVFRFFDDRTDHGFCLFVSEGLLIAKARNLPEGGSLVERALLIPVGGLCDEDA